ncbi:MAG: ABC transporter permease [Oscillospiraceae bacterium]|nr:ABC transporter permease [Oscillospiraceae bacterium]
MKNILTVMKKEFARFFGDKRMIMMTLLPAVLIYVVYSFMGTAVKNLITPDEQYVPTAYATNMPHPILELARSAGVSIVDIGMDEVENVKSSIAAKEKDVCVVFPPDFEAKALAYDVRVSTEPAPNVEVFFNSTETNSTDTYGRIIAILDEYQDSLAKSFDVNKDVPNADLATIEDVSAGFISMLMPMLMMIFLYSGSMGLALESITGEKERGTLATLLVTPLKRSELAIGKILSLATLSFMSGLVTALSTILSLPKLMSGADEIIDAGIYGGAEYVFLAAIILSTLLLLVTAISIVSAFAKTVKEASAAVMPLMFLVMLVSVTGMFGGATPADPGYYLLPIYSSVQSMSGVFSLNYSGLNIALSCLSNIVYACAGAFALTKMFNSEKVMFSR